MKEKEIRTEVAIVGGGMVGMSLAIALAQEEVPVVVIDRQPLELLTSGEQDGRVSAISYGSERMFRRLGVWDAMSEKAEPIHDIRVSDNNSLAFVHYHYEDVGNDPFGHIIENSVVRSALVAGIKFNPSIHYIAPAALVSLERDATNTTLTLNDGTVVRAPLIIGADGKNSSIRKEAGIRARELDYGQTAIVCTIAHEEPHQGLAQERFLPVGPFAVLPMTQNRSSLVWTEKTAMAPVMLALSDEEFIQEITHRVGDYLGRITLAGKRFSYPLSLLYADRYVDNRLALVGDAAHAIHPIAGQGVNLGFRDVAVMAELVADAYHLGLDVGAPSLLSHYQQWRRFDTLAMVAVTDGLNRLFSNDVTPVRMVRDAGLAVVNRIPPLKKFFMRHAMGVVGTLPKLMREAA